MWTLLFGLVTVVVIRWVETVQKEAPPRIVTVTRLSRSALLLSKPLPPLSLTPLIGRVAVRQLPTLILLGRPPPMLTVEDIRTAVYLLLRLKMTVSLLLTPLRRYLVAVVADTTRLRHTVLRSIPISVSVGAHLERVLVAFPRPIEVECQS